MTSFKCEFTPDLRRFHVSLLNHVTSSYAVTGTGRSLGNRVTQWTHQEMVLEETLGGNFPSETFGTRGPSSSNTATAWPAAENCLDGNSLTIAGIVSPTLIGRGVLVQRAPLRSVSGCPTAGWMVEKTWENGVSKTTQETPTIMKPGGAQCRTDQTPWGLITELVPWTRWAEAVIVHWKETTTRLKVDGLDSPGINHAHRRVSKSVLTKTRDQGSDPSGKTMRTTSKRSPTGQKKTNPNSGTGLQVWTETWTLRCPVRGSKDGSIRNPTTRPSWRRKRSPSKWTWVDP